LTGTGGVGATGVQGATGIAGVTGVMPFTWGTAVATGAASTGAVYFQYATGASLQGVTGAQGQTGLQGTVNGITGAFYYKFTSGVTGPKGSIQINFPYNITNWVMFGGNTGVQNFDIWRSTTASYPPTRSNTIIGPTGVQGLNNTLIGSGTTSSWTGVTGVAGDCLLFNVDTSGTVNSSDLTLQYFRYS
jgi:hypothetical protein